MDATLSFYRVAYRVGFHPWEDLADHPPFADTLVNLIALDEDGSGRHGKALDLGCGSAVWGVRLAQRGWEVTCVDIVDRALDRARRRAAASGVNLDIRAADVTDLGPAGLAGGFRLILDTGTFHGLTDAQRVSMGREVDLVAAPDATVLIDAFAPRRRGPLPRGCTRREVEAAFPDWRVVAEEVADTNPDPIARVLNFDERFYRLRRV